MSSLSISTATEVYRQVSRCEISRHAVDHPLLADVSSSIRTLCRSLQHEAEDDFWHRTLGPIRRLAFTFCSVPVPFSRSSQHVKTDWAKLRRNVRMCRQLFPDWHCALEGIVERLEQLSAEDDSPLIAPLERLVRTDDGLSVLIRNPRMNRVTDEFLSTSSNLRGIQILSPAQLRSGPVCRALATIGPCSWFPEYVFSAPRATAVHVISFRWIRDAWRPGPVLLHAHGEEGEASGSHRLGDIPRIHSESATSSMAPSDLLPTDLLPPAPRFTLGSFDNAGSLRCDSEETVAARLCWLVGDRAVYVAVEEGATSLIIDPSETGRSRVKRVPTVALEAGQYLLLRTSGGGDFIAPLADRIMGDRAREQRSKQVAWKRQMLSNAVEQFGPSRRRVLASRTAAYFRSNQLSNASAANVYYWMSAKCIHPRKYDDFLACLTFAHLEESAEEYWRAMKDINRAHTKAGALIRRLLLQQIAESSLNLLERDGEMVFDLGDQDGGTLTALQITHVGDVDGEIPTDRTGVLLTTED